jgi:hypothetical protein
MEFMNTALQIKTEEWRTLQDFPDYAVSNYGNVKRIRQGRTNGYKDRVLSANVSSNARYRRVSLLKNHERFDKHIHDIVADIFIGKKPNGMHVNHKDGNKLNNHIDNLEYVTPAENIRHAQRTGLMKKQYGEHTSGAKITDEDVLKIIELRKKGYSIGKLITMFPVKVQTLAHIFHGRTWSHLTGITPDNTSLHKVRGKQQRHIGFKGNCVVCGDEFISNRSSRILCGKNKCRSRRYYLKHSDHVIKRRW